MSTASSAALPGNEVKLLGKGPGTGRTALDGQARAARCAAPQPGHNEEDR